MKVRKAIIPAAGFGTRFLPATRSVPKELLPILDKPVIQYAVEEAAQAGIEDIVIVISKGKEAISSYFNRTPELEQALEEKGNLKLLEEMRRIPEMARISYVIQEEQLGLGHAVLTAQSAIGREPFAVFLPDDIILDEEPTIGRMMRIFEEYGGSLIAVKEVPREAIPSMGIIKPKQITDDLYQVLDMVEKPRVEDAPSNLGIIGRYILTPEVFDALERGRPGAIGEIQLTDGIAALLPTQKVYVYRFPGTHFDVGTPLGMLRASLYFASQRPDMAEEVRGWAEVQRTMPPTAPA